MKFESYWLDVAPKFEGGKKDDLDGRVDVAVVGGGLTGLSAAYSLVKRGASVIVLEANRVVGEASGRNGGQCNNGLLQDYVTLARKVGAERARCFYRAFNAAVDTVERLITDENINCEFRRCGKLKLAAKPRHYDHMVSTYTALKSGVDPDIRLIPPDQIREEINSNAFHGGLLQTTSAQLDVGRFGVGLADVATRYGVQIYESAAVKQIKRTTEHGYRLITDRGTVEATQVFLATGCMCNGGPFAWFRRRIVPVGSFIIVTEPLEPSELDRLFPGRRCYVTSMNIGNYFRITPDSRLLFGGRARFAMSNRQSDEKSGRLLRSSLEQFFPELRNVRIDYCWGGLVDMTWDRLPRAGEHQGIYYSMGYSGHGVQMSIHMGQIMTDVMEGRTHTNPWREINWPAIPFHFGKPWFLPAVGAYYRLRDTLH